MIKLKTTCRTTVSLSVTPINTAAAADETEKNEGTCPFSTKHCIPARLGEERDLYKTELIMKLSSVRAI